MIFFHFPIGSKYCGGSHLGFPVLMNKNFVRDHQMTIIYVIYVQFEFSEAQ
jgi:hypothetical protein